MVAAKGGKRTVPVSRLERCKPCKGSGVKEGQKAKKCTACGGTGSMRITQGGFQFAMQCNACGGEGTTIPHSARCRSCEGHGLVEETTTVDVDIPAGVDTGTQVRLTGKGNVPDRGTGPAGDLYLEFQVEPSPLFDRSGADVLTTVTIPLSTALLGGSVRVPTVDGDVELTIEPGTQPFSKRILRGRGVPDITTSMRSSRKGDEIVTLRIEIPRKLSEEQREGLKRVFGVKLESKESKAEREGEGKGKKEEGKSTSPLDEGTDKTADRKDKKSGGSFFRSAFDRIKDIKEGLGKEEGSGKEGQDGKGREGKKEAKDSV
ncbi:hypothetical protein HK097_003191 [Rhizophlyctis rosea]|uniref:DnaJ homolog 1, mitochondrial n=1 Tax=Rhizophlyctis rosea TaxID=64517 RepID=A0AAD5S3X4_9FUNG|nr:hypothetical protein HK097_003191 [Rhizophlyctis rosea]